MYNFLFSRGEKNNGGGECFSLFKQNHEEN